MKEKREKKKFIINLFDQSNKKREEIIKRKTERNLRVLAFPKASNKGFELNNRSFTIETSASADFEDETAAIYSMILLEASVFPAPDSPLTRIH